MDTPRTTVVACVLQGNAAYWAHCGDSRLYLVRGDKLVARTRDHSYSELQETLAQVVPMGERFNRNVLFTCLGSPGKPVVDTAGPLLLQPGDRVLLCSDGLWGTRRRRRDRRAAGAHADLRRGARAGRDGAARRPAQAATTSPCSRVEWEAAEDVDSHARHLDRSARRRGLRLDHPGQPGRRRAGRRTRRRRDRALDPRDQRSDPALRKRKRPLRPPGHRRTRADSGSELADPRATLTNGGRAATPCAR
ncbi:MAG: hypothetical protein MZW92_57205 [Comamonadaceae bacterium]|nr:hypothetical protein [Comamonadaceae bacterium]